MKPLVFAVSQPQDIYSQKEVPPEQSFGFVLSVTLVLALFWLSVNIIVPWLVRFLVPKRFFNENALLFKERSFESTLYRKLKVVRWKDKLPDAGKLIHFQRDTLPQDINRDYINRFITECCIAELGHLTVGILGFASLFFVFLFPDSNTTELFMIFLILSIMDFIIQMLFVIIQRYNRPRLIKLRKLYSHGYKTRLK